MATNSVSQPAPSTESRRLPVTRWLGHFDAFELLGVDVQQVAGRGMFVALHGLSRRQVAQLGQAGTRQHTADGGFGHPHRLGDAGLQLTAVAQLHDEQRLGRIDGPRRPAQVWKMRQLTRLHRRPGSARATRAPWLQSRQTALATSPDVLRPSTVSSRTSLHSTDVRESGMLVAVHSADPLEVWVFGDFQSPRLSPDEHRIQPIEASHLGRAGAPDPNLRALPLSRCGKRRTNRASLSVLGVTGSSFCRVLKIVEIPRDRVGASCDSSTLARNY